MRRLRFGCLLRFFFFYLIFLPKAQPGKKPRFFSSAICDYTPRGLFMAQPVLAQQG
jgi:hypothetical protein